MSGRYDKPRISQRAALKRLRQGSRTVFSRTAIRSSGAPQQSMITRKISGESRATISFVVRFWALTLSSSANDGVKRVINGLRFTLRDAVLVHSILRAWICAEQLGQWSYAARTCASDGRVVIVVFEQLRYVADLFRRCQRQPHAELRKLPCVTG